MTAEPPENLEEFMFMDSKKEVITPHLDQEWIRLIQEAKEVGLSVKEVKAFLDNTQT
ncbi:anti-repressor SinI family protein [Sphingomonas sp. PsM26]|nr:anti-repressor SinI family protein [Sphingomonas sp. PsM26]